MYRPDLLHEACRRGNLELVKDLVDHQRYERSHTDAGLKDGGNVTPLHAARGRSHPQVVEFLSTQYCDVNARNLFGYTPLHVACNRIGTRSEIGPHLESNIVDTVKLLLACNDIEINAQNDDGSTPLHLACNLGYSNVVKMLVGHRNIEINSRNNRGNTPLHMACATPRHVVVRKAGTSVHLAS